MSSATGETNRHWHSILLVGLVAGCSGSSDTLAPKPRLISLAEFAQPTMETRVEDGMPKVPSEGEEAKANSSSIRLGAGSTEMEDPGVLESGTWNAARQGLRLSKPGDRVLVDSLVGQINGRPIFADDILLPIEDQLIAESRQYSTLEEFAVRARDIVFERMQAVVISELFLAEAESSLTSEQQQGLLYFLRSLREQEIAKRGGSQEQAERVLQDEEGISLDEFLDRSMDETLIREMVLRKIRARVIVSRRDIEREYKRRYQEFNPPPLVTLSRIRLSASQAELVEDVSNRFAEGEDFAAVAESVGMRERGLWDTFPMGPGGVSDIEIQEAYKPYLLGLEVGDTTEPMEVRDRVMWLHVTTIDRPEGRSLYDPDVQQMLENQIYARRMNEERNRYITNLLEKSTLDDLAQMVERTLNVALRRYGP